MGAGASNAVIFGDGFIDGGRNIEEPRIAKLRGAEGIALADATREVSNVLEKGVKIFAKASKRLDNTR